MDRFLARQPILTSEKHIFGYEILSRLGPENYFRPPEGEAIHVNAMDELFLMGLKQMTNGLPAFVNCSREFLLRDYLELLPREFVVGEILETVKPQEDIVAACRRMKDKGYRMALDDYQDSPEMERLVDLADFIKIDFLATSLGEQARLGEIPAAENSVGGGKSGNTGTVSARDSDGLRIISGIFFLPPADGGTAGDGGKQADLSAADRDAGAAQL